MAVKIGTPFETQIGNFAHKRQIITPMTIELDLKPKLLAPERAYIYMSEVELDELRHQVIVALEAIQIGNIVKGSGLQARKCAG